MNNRMTRKIFKYIYKNPNNQSIAKVKEHFKFSNIDIFSCCEELSECDLIFIYDTSIVLTPTGKDYYYNRHKKLLLNLFKLFITSIVIPIIVSYITTRFITSDQKSCDKANNDSYNYANSKE